MKKHKILTACLSLALGTTCLLTGTIGCSNKSSDNGITWYSATSQALSTENQFYYSDGVNSEGLYDNTILYRNDLDFPDAPDPGVVYNPDDGYYYAFHTAAPIKCYRTKNFANWELYSYAFTPSDDSWAYGNYWAPEVIQSKTEISSVTGKGKWYMYYNASATTIDSSVTNPNNITDRMMLGVAESDYVYGPYTESRDGSGNCIKFDIAASSKGQSLLSGKTQKVWGAIDAHPFYDGNQLYLYLAKSADKNTTENSIWGMKMTNMTTPDYNTLTQLTRCNYTNVSGGSTLSFETGCTVNEGPYMVKHTSPTNGKTMYYLTYSIYGYTDRKYAVCVATSDSPLGTFTKLQSQYNQPLLGITADYDHMSGTGHASLVESPSGEMYIFYHGHRDVEVPTGVRGMAVDRVVWEYNATLGYDIMHANGPEKALQYSPVEATGWGNIIKDATISISSTPSSGTQALLTDGVVTIREEFDKNKDLVLPEGTNKITITFPTARKVRALMVYNSYNSWIAFKTVKNIKLTSSTGSETIAQIAFPTEYYSDDLSFMRPGGAAFVEFTVDPSKAEGTGVDIISIEFTLDDKIYPTQNSSYTGIALSEIVVLGK